MGSRQVAQLLRALLDPAARARGFAEAAILADWSLVVGPALAARCRPVEVRFPNGRRGAGVLVLETGTAAALELQHGAPQIVERVNRFFGLAAVRALRFVPVPQWTAPRAPEPPPEPRRLTAEEEARIEAEVAGLAPHPALRAALADLGRAALARPAETAARGGGLAGRRTLP